MLVPSKPLALLCTNHIAAFSGSEAVVADLGDALHEAGYEVHLVARVADPVVLAGYAGSFDRIKARVEAFHGFDYDFIWSQHLFWPDILSLSAKGSLLFGTLVCASLSPFEALETPPVSLHAAPGIRLAFNSPECRLAHGLDSAAGLVFHNAAPPAFWRVQRGLRPHLRKLLCISNHVPAFVRDGLAEIGRAGVEVELAGVEGTYRRIRPGDLDQADAVVSIGKSAAYAIAAGCPIYVADRVGAQGWLSADNFERCADYNFSGRPDGRMIQPDRFAEEVLSGYPDAAHAWSGRSGWMARPERFDLAQQLRGLLADMVPSGRRVPFPFVRHEAHALAARVVNSHNQQFFPHLLGESAS